MSIFTFKSPKGKKKGVFETHREIFKDMSKSMLIAKTVHLKFSRSGCFTYSAFTVVQSFVIFIKLLSNFELDKIVSKSACRLDRKHIPFLFYELLGLQHVCYFARCKIYTFAGHKSYKWELKTVCCYNM